MNIACSLSIYMYMFRHSSMQLFYISPLHFSIPEVTPRRARVSLHSLQCASHSPLPKSAPPATLPDVLRALEALQGHTRSSTFLGSQAGRSPPDSVLEKSVVAEGQQRLVCWIFQGGCSVISASPSPEKARCP